jgi:cytochrome b
MSARMVSVWDPYVRIGHWLLAALFATAYLTEGEPLWLHSWSGYGIAALVVARVVWGLVGPRHARFADFLTGPAAVLADLAALARGRAQRHLGHTPAGGWAIVGLLVLLAGTTLSGMANLAWQKGTGPLSPFIDRGAQAGIVLVPPAHADDDEEQERSEGRRGEKGPFQEVHELFANLTLAMVLIHVTGVIVVTLATGENLIGAMISGKKRAIG